MARHHSPRIAVATLGSALLVLLAAAPASAHVTVNPRSAPAGGYAALTFRVPTESSTASTTALEVVLPADRPIASVAVKPHPGWSYEVTRSKPTTPLTAHGAEVTDVVSSITWTADESASAIKPGEFDEFQISAGPLPDSGSLVFKALQTYSDGTVVRWIELPATDGTEPDHPAPVLTLDVGTAPAHDVPGPSVAAAEPQAPAPEGAGAAVVLSVVALVVAGAGAAAGWLALRRTRPSSRS